MKVTGKALEQFKNAIEQYNLTGSGIRLYASDGCCCPEVKMSVVNHLSAGETMITISGVVFFVESQADQILTNVSIDFRDNNFKLDGLKKSEGCCG